MFNNIIAYVQRNNNLLLVVVLLFILAVLYFFLMRRQEHYTTLSEIDQLPVSIGGLNNLGITNPAAPGYVNSEKCLCSNKFDPNLLLLSGHNKYVRFRCIINGKRYYLMIAPIASCSNIRASATECAQNILILADETTALSGIEQYKQTMINKQKTCNFQQNLLCSSAQPETASGKCSESYSLCDLPRQTPIDFSLTLATPLHSTCVCGNLINKYTIAGVNGYLGATTTAVTKNLLNINTRLPITITSMTSVICSDVYSPINNSQVLVDLITTTREVIDDTARSSEAQKYTNILKTRIRFTTQTSPLATTDPATLLPVTRMFYLGSCKNNICTTNGQNYMRACLLYDILDPNVLEFEPVVVQY